MRVLFNLAKNKPSWGGGGGGGGKRGCEFLGSREGDSLSFSQNGCD